MSQLMHDILGKITVIRTALWEAQNTYPDDTNIKVANQEVSNLLTMLEDIKT